MLSYLSYCFRTFQIFLYTLFLTPAVALAQIPDYQQPEPTYGWGWGWFWLVAAIVVAFALAAWAVGRGRGGRRSVP